MDVLLPVYGTENILCDNRGVVRNSSVPESTLQINHNSINYHEFHKSVNVGILRFGKEYNQPSIVDLLKTFLTVRIYWNYVMQ